MSQRCLLTQNSEKIQFQIRMDKQRQMAEAGEDGKENQGLLYLPLGLYQPLLLLYTICLHL